MPCPVSPTKLPVDPERNLLQLFLEKSEELTTSRTYGFITDCMYIGEVKLLRVAELCDRLKRNARSASAFFKRKNAVSPNFKMSVSGYAEIPLFTCFCIIILSLWSYLPADYPVRRPSYLSTVGAVLHYHGHNMLDNMAATLKVEMYGYEVEPVQKKKTNNIPVIYKHLKNIFEKGNLQKEVVVSKVEITTQHGAIEVKTQTSLVDFHHLDTIIAIGYRVNPSKATKFCQGATKVLNEYMRKGFVLDDEHLKQGTAVLDKDCFRDLLEKVRSIRTSERRI